MGRRGGGYAGRMKRSVAWSLTLALCWTPFVLADPPRLVAQFKDLDGDGVVSGYEVARQIAGDVQGIFQEELDGQQDAAVLRARLLRYAKALFGDFDGDNRVDTDDMIVLFTPPACPPPRSKTATSWSIRRSTHLMSSR